MIMKKLLLTLKKYWKVLLLILGIIFSILMLKKQETNFVENLRSIQDAHKSEIKKINEVREKERELHELNEEKYRSTIAGIHARYEAEKRELSEKKKKQVETIVKKYGDDPDQLALQLSKATGFQIILPEE